MPGPKVNREDAAELWRKLKGRGFRKGREISMESRKIRAICNEYPQHFLSTQRGYKLVRESTTNEIENAVADLVSRCNHMTRRAAALQTVARERGQPGLDL